MSHLIGYDITMDDLQNFRQLKSRCPGHPERGITPGVEVTTGPLGQGIANGVGMAIGVSHLAKLYNKPNLPIFNNFIYVVCGDGCLQEGVAAEAISLAGTLKLGRLIVLYDNNNIQIDGSTNLSFTEDIQKRFESMGWHYQYISHGDTDIDGIEKAVEVAKNITDKPSIISIKTTIGYASKKQGTADVHGAP
uniref:Transketolase 1 n=1 Tax=Lygus hesperus TaxID=30085 RepID=A0A0A9ZG03_LYGHE